MSNWGGGYNLGFQTIMHYSLRYARFFVSQPEEINFWHLEAESSIRLDAIRRQTSHGGSRVVGYRSTTTLYIPNNAYTDQAGDLEVLRAAGELSNVHIGMGSAIYETIEASGFWYLDCSGADVPGPLSAGVRDTVVMTCKVTDIRIETIERRPRAIITIEAEYSTRLFEDGIRQAFFGNI